MTQSAASYVANKVSEKGISWAADYLDIPLDEASSMSSESGCIVLAQIKNWLAVLQEDVDVLRHCDLDSASKCFEDAFVLLKGGKDHEAFKEMEKVLDLAITAFDKVKKFQDKVECKELSIFCRMMTLSYDRDKKIFLPLDKVPDQTKKIVAELAFTDLKDVVAKFDKIEVSLMKRMTGGKHKKKELEALNGLLRCTLPVIWHHLDTFSPGMWMKGKENEVLKYLPKGGQEDGAVIPLGCAGTLKVWKSGDSLDVCCIIGRFEPSIGVC